MGDEALAGHRLAMATSRPDKRGRRLERATPMLLPIGIDLRQEFGFRRPHALEGRSSTGSDRGDTAGDGGSVDGSDPRALHQYLSIVPPGSAQGSGPGARASMPGS
jgi:hypothetical protein